MESVTEELVEAPDIALTEEDTGYLFLLLKTVVDLLDRATSSSLKKSSSKRDPLP